MAYRVKSEMLRDSVAQKQGHNVHMHDEIKQSSSSNNEILYLYSTLIARVRVQLYVTVLVTTL